MTLVFSALQTEISNSADGHRKHIASTLMLPVLLISILIFLLALLISFLLKQIAEDS